MSLATGLVADRELLWNFTLRDLRTRYKRTTLGWLWSLLNPLAMTILYAVLFRTVFRIEAPLGDPSGLRNYGLFVLCGLLPWNFYNYSVQASMEAMVANATLIRKVYFRRELLPLASVLAFLATLLVELGVLVVALLIAGNMVVPWLPVTLVLVLLLGLYTAGFALLLSGGYVYLRDLKHLWTILAQILFYASPIVYPVSLVPERVRAIYELNPMTVFVEAMRDTLYDLRMPPALDLAYLTVVSGAVFALGLWAFRRMAVRIAEEL